ncbi:conserved hypothetical protein [Sphingobacterium sp. PM2-P1-29]|nr:conserved hypothetical protein [Sphingobacterium sp. PM2-P1-29]
MIVRILNSTSTFEAVRYNTNKVDKDKGELVKTANFGALQALTNLRPSDYVNYLELQSSASKRTKYPQFHVAISCKGRSHSKHELTEIAEQWLNGMGYGDQPYMLIFHKDTKNNHIHIVSTRVDRNGKKIKDNFEKLRAYEVLNQVIGKDEKEAAKIAIEKALLYNFSTRAQFMMILESQGYGLKLSETSYQLAKFGKYLGEVKLADVDNRISQFQKNVNRLAQIRAIVHKYRPKYDPTVKVLAESGDNAYTSDLAKMLASKFGIYVHFHGMQGKPPYGYTLIDHSGHGVYKGGDLMPLSDFIGSVEWKNLYGNSQQENLKTIDEEPQPKNPDLTIAEKDFDAYPYQSQEEFLPHIQINIADDIDDEAVHGKNRRRKRKARTNTR